LVSDAEELRAMIADLDDYITRKAQELAEPIIAREQAGFEEALFRSHREAERWQALNAELSRRIPPLERQCEQAREARDRLAAALGFRAPALVSLPLLVRDIETQLAALKAQQDAPEVRQ
jgi:hypothetical protein